MLQRPRGTRDLLPDDMVKRRAVEKVMEAASFDHGFGEVKTPMFEELELFTMRSGEGVISEIYDFKDKSGRHLALRPELTAAVIRLYANEMRDIPKPVKVFYFGECFRYERPQKGRYREFKQFGAEILGGDEVAINIEIVTLALAILNRMALKGFKVRIGYLDILRRMFELGGVERADQGQYMRLIDKGDLDALRERLAENGLEDERTEDILKVLKVKDGTFENKAVMDILTKDEQISGYMKRLKLIYDGVLLSGLTKKEDIGIDLGIARGLDYYTGLVFEVDVPELGAEKQVCGGGAYALAELFGIDPMNTTGFAMGIDRLILALERQGSIAPNEGPTAYVIPFEGTKVKALEIVGALRRAGISVDHDLTGRNISKNLKYAASIRAKNALIVGLKEMEKGIVTVRDMTSGEQREVPIDELAGYFGG